MKDDLRHAAPHRDRRWRRRRRGRGPDRARGHGGDRHPRRLHQAHAAAHLPLAAARRQGPPGMATKDEDFVTRLFVANTHTPLLFFTSRGMVYKLKIWRLPLGTPQRAARRSSTSCRSRRRAHHRDPAAAGGRGGGTSSTHVRDPPARAAQQALRLRRRQPQRQDRDEARRGRRDLGVRICSETMTT